MAGIRKPYKPGEAVPATGIYRVTHGDAHEGTHEVTCLFGETFPACHHCGDRPRFVLVREAPRVRNHLHFKPAGK